MIFSDDEAKPSSTRFAEGIVFTGSSKDITSRSTSGSLLPGTGST